MGEAFIDRLDRSSLAILHEHDTMIPRSLALLATSLLLGALAVMAPNIAHAALPLPPPVPVESRAEGAFDDRADEHRVETRLYANLEHAAPGQTVRLGVWVHPDEHWHTYWRNSGDAGLATRVDFVAKAPHDTLTISAMSWPAPHVFFQPQGDITTYGYEDQVLHVGEVQIPADVTPGTTITFEATADYLTCKVECIPGRQTMTLTLPVEVESKPSAEQITALFERHDASLPVSAKEAGFALDVATSQDQIRPGDEVAARVDLALCQKESARACPRYELDIQDMEGDPTRAFVPDLADGMVWKPTKVEVAPDGRVVSFWLSGRASPGKPAKSTRLAGVILMRDAASKVHVPVYFEHALETAAAGSEVEVRALDGGASDSARAKEIAPEAAQNAPEGPEGFLGMLYVLLLAFLGGMLLNVMPCVFPVLTIKVASIAQVAHKESGAMLAHGLAYSAGILVTMMGLASVVLALRAAGAQVGWGFQFQNPYFLLGLSGILILFATNLFGAFEFDIPMGDKLGAMADIEPGLKQSFAEGLLCVLLATPCSAPFMGTAVGFALSASALTVLAIFFMLGLGLALPFLVLCALPGWARLLPKPGPWLDHLKKLLAFSLLATSIWLLWLIGQSFGANGMALATAFLLATAIGCWMAGLVQYRSGMVLKNIVRLAALALVSLAGLWCHALFSEAPEVAATTATADAGGELIAWRAFDEAAIEEELAAGRPVFVDFTADWCITCKVNERTVLVSEDVLAAIKAHDVVMFKADWTRRDDRIRRILQANGKGGVPMYLMYTPAHPNSPKVLPELLTPSLVVDAMKVAGSE